MFVFLDDTVKVGAMQEFGNPFSQKSLLLSCYPNQGNVGEMDIKVINIKVTLDPEWLSRPI